MRWPSRQDKVFAPWYGDINTVLSLLLLVIWLPVQMVIGLYIIADDPISYIIAHSPIYYCWMTLSHFLALFTAMLLLVSGRRLSRGTRGGVLLSAIYAVYGLVAGALHVSLTYFCLYCPLLSKQPIWPQQFGAARGSEYVLVLIAVRLAWMAYLGMLLERVSRACMAAPGGARA